MNFVFYYIASTKRAMPIILRSLPLRLIVYTIPDSFSGIEQGALTPWILPERLAERTWYTKSQFSLLNIYSCLLEVGSNPRSCSHLFALRRRIAESYSICSWRATFKIGAAPRPSVTEIEPKSSFLICKQKPYPPTRHGFWVGVWRIWYSAKIA